MQTVRGSSRLLAAIGPEALQAAGVTLDPVRLDVGRTVVGAHEPIRRVYFPDTCLIAISLMLPDGRTAGVTMVGDEGVVGLSSAVGVPAGTDAEVLVPGVARTMPAERFRTAMHESEAFQSAIEGYAIALQAHLAQTVACNRLHSLDQRAARWLLLAHDRVPGETFPLTQEAFADLLGVSRPAVSTVGARFARAGAAEFRRGTVHILDLARLERASCDCLEADREA
ncbi:MAG TPA: Crp/Fnr family transcriptional regulator, partial [Candidatus Limnocylindrales bacterium]|nr:Crp/Fnr family transcriptional regulator [Candidatus Limnocylindrales bacterium]